MFIHGTTKLMKKNKFVTINDVLNIENIHSAYLSVMKTCKKILEVRTNLTFIKILI